MICCGMVETARLRHGYANSHLHLRRALREIDAERLRKAVEYIRWWSSLKARRAEEVWKPETDLKVKALPVVRRGADARAR